MPMLDCSILLACTASESACLPKECTVYRMCYASLTRCTTCSPPTGICAPSPLIPCGVRGLPLCVEKDALCEDLLAPAFPQMVCIDTSRSNNDEPKCGVLGEPACVDLVCVAPLVVHPNTKVCVPPQSEACGSVGQTQCFWNDVRPCNEGLTADRGLCVE